MQDPNQPQQPQQPQPYPVQPQPQSQAAYDQQPVAQQPAAYPQEAQQFAQEQQAQPQPQQPTDPFAQQPQATSPFFATQTPQADTTTQFQQQPVAGAPLPPQQPIEPKKSKKVFIIIGIIAAVLIAGGIAAFVLLSNNGSKNVSSTQAGTSDAAEIDPSEKQSVTIGSINEYGAICENKKAPAAPTTGAPYKPLLFFKTADTWAIYATADSRVSADPNEINVISCISVDPSTEKLVKSGCEATNISTRSTVTVDAYSATYKVTHYAPATGEVIKETTVTPSSEECPRFATEAGKHYLIPTDADFKPAIDVLFAS